MKLLHYIGLLTAMLTGQALADTAYIPPQSPQAAIIRASDGQPIELRSDLGSSARYDANTHKIKVLKRPHFSNASAGTVYKVNPVTFTGSYGEKAAGTIKTQTQLPANSTLAKLGGAYMGASVGSAVLNSSYAHQAAQSLAKGDYGMAAAQAAASFDVFNIGKAISDLKDIYQGEIEREAKAAAQQKANKAAAAAQAAADAWNEANGDYQKYLPDPITGLPAEYPVLQIWWGGTEGVGIVPQKVAVTGGSYGIYEELEPYGLTIGTPGCDGPSDCEITHFKWIKTNAENYKEYEHLVREAINRQGPQPRIEDFLLSQIELQKLMTKQLDEMLKNGRMTNEQLKDLANALWASGGIGPSSTQTQITGGDAANTFSTAPFTPVGSQTAQQTQFIVYQDGRVTTTIINRPDLAAHTSQAPTRAPIQAPAATAPNPAKENPTAEKPDICKANPNSLMCAELGNADYEDIAIPERKLDFNFEPANIFSSNGICPQPKQLQILGSIYELSYQPMCNFASGVRPMIILLGMVLAMGMAYSAIKEL